MSLGHINAILDRLEAFLRSQDGKTLSNGQRAVLFGLLVQPNFKYEQLAAELKKLGLGSYQPQTLRNDAYNVFKRLTGAFGFEVKKKNLQRSVLAWHQEQGSSVKTDQVSMNSAPTMKTPGNLLQLDCWQDDLAYLTQQVQDGRRVVGISGPPLIGKTYFAYALCDRLQPLFESPPIWCTASQVKTPEALYQTVMERLGNAPRQGPAIPALTDLFRSRRLLLVVDDTEALYQPRQLAGRFEPSVQDYDHWLRQLPEVPVLQGCLLWVGRESPICFEYPRGVLVLHRMGKLQDQDAQALLSTWNTPLDSPEERASVLQFCGENPAWLLMAVTRAQQLHQGTMAAFLANPFLPETVMETLNQTLDRLSPAERVLLIWLMVYPLPPDQWSYGHIPDLSVEEQQAALLSLQGRGLIHQESPTACYCVDPPLLCYGLARQIVTGAEAELTMGDLQELTQYPILHTGASADRQAWQRQHLLEPIAQRLQRRYGFRHEQLTCFQECLQGVRSLPLPQQGYAAGNLMNLALALTLPLDELDFDGLEIHHADLRPLGRSPFNLAHCTLHQALLPTNLSDRLVAALSPDGTLLAAGDPQGHLLCWWREDTTVKLHRVWQAASSIDALLCPDPDTVLLIAHQTLYSWWMDSEPQPQPIINLPEFASCLAHSSLGHIAVGLSNGQILLWEGSLHPVRTLDLHRSEVCSIAFSPDGLRLASLDRDNRLVLWDLASESEPSSGQEIPTHSALCLAVGWDHDTLLRADVSPYRIRLWSGEKDFREQAIADPWMTTLQFSADGRHLIGRTDGDRVIHWAWQSESLVTLSQGAIVPGNLAISNQGQWLLVTTPTQIHLMDRFQRERIWQAESNPGDWSLVKFDQVSGLSSPEITLLHSLGVQQSNAPAEIDS